MTDPNQDQDDRVWEKPRRRGWRLGGIAVVLAAIAYWASPYIGVARLALAANAGSTQAVLQRIDAPALRASFSRQIVRAYIARNPQTRDLDPLARQLVSSVAAGYVEALIAEHLTPEAIAGLIARQGRAADAGGLIGREIVLPRMDDLSGIWALFGNAGFDGPASFAVSAPASAGSAAEDGYRLRFHIAGWSWKLRAVDLPQETLIRLADELKARNERGA